MHLQAIRTRPIVPGVDTNLFAILDEYITFLDNNSVLAVTSKIVAICEGRIASLDLNKDELIQQEADWFLPRSSNRYNVCLTIKNGTLAASAGIDESNANGHYILLPENPQNTANQIRQYLKTKFQLKNFGVIITDSISSPLRWGVRGIALAYSGFVPFRNYIGKSDIFGRTMRYSKVFLPDPLATAAVLLMGEGNESQPLVIISQLDFLDFVDRNPSPEELASVKIELEDDLYAPLLTAVKWLPSKKKINQSESNKTNLTNR
jgi:putative folate metabolism gamma-glutamate ligase